MENWDLIASFIREKRDNKIERKIIWDSLVISINILQSAIGYDDAELFLYFSILFSLLMYVLFLNIFNY